MPDASVLCMLVCSPESMQLVAWRFIKVRANHPTTNQAKPQVLVGLHLRLLRPVVLNSTDM